MAKNFKFCDLCKNLPSLVALYLIRQSYGIIVIFDFWLSRFLDHFHGDVDRFAPAVPGFDELNKWRQTLTDRVLLQCCLTVALKI